MTLDEYYKAMLEAQLGAGNIAAIGKDAANQEQRAANWTQMSAQPAGSGWAGALAQGLRGGMAGYSTSKADKAQKLAGEKTTQFIEDMRNRMGGTPTMSYPAGNNPDEMQSMPSMSNMSAPTANMATAGQQMPMSAEALAAEELRKRLAQQGGMQY